MERGPWASHETSDNLPGCGACLTFVVFVTLVLLALSVTTVLLVQRIGL